MKSHCISVEWQCSLKRDIMHVINSCDRHLKSSKDLASFCCLARTFCRYCSSSSSAFLFFISSIPMPPLSDPVSKERFIMSVIYLSEHHCCWQIHGQRRKTKIDYPPVFIFKGIGSTLPAPKHVTESNITVWNRGYYYHHLGRKSFTLLAKALTSFVTHLLQQCKSLVLIANGVL